MKIVKVERDGQHGEGVLVGETVRLIGGWKQGPADEGSFTLPSQTVAVLEQRCIDSKESVPLASVQLAVPVDPLRKIIGVGLNYRDHAGESQNELPAEPMLFTRSLDSLVGPGQPIVRPRVSERFDFEGEIAVVIGRPARHVPAAEAMAHVFGYCCFNDGSVRDYQRHALMTGKNFWRSGAMGPWIVTSDEIADADLALKTRLNGKDVQSGRASDMLFGIAELIEYCSRWTLLQPGDVIATGTPAGVGARRTPPLWMRPGDLVEVEINLLGVLSNPVADEV